MIKTICLFLLYQIYLGSSQIIDATKKECPQGWVLWKDSCYYFSRTARPWQLAGAVCRSLDRNARLAEIETKEESDFLEKTVFENAYMNCYYDTAERLLDGDFLDDAHNLTNEKCVQYCRQKGFTYAGTQYSRQCFCGDNLDKYSPRNQQECELRCTGDSFETCGGHWRLSVYLTAGAPHWLGGKCVPVDKEWKWFSSKKYINGYTDWSQKRACNKESCLDLNVVEGGRYKWDDENCLKHLHFICEAPATRPTITQETTTAGSVNTEGCINTCEGMPEGDYQACNGCKHYITCVYGSPVWRPCPSELVWDDMAKRCRYTSTTCFIK